MPHTKEIITYQFSELSESAREKARGWYREGSIYDFSNNADCVVDDAARMASLFGLDIRTRPIKLMNGSSRQEPSVYWSGFWSQGDGASFDGSYSYSKGSVSAVAKGAPTTEANDANMKLNQIVRELTDIQKRNFYQVQAIIRHGSRGYAHARTMDIDVERADSKPISDSDVEAVRELMVDFANWIYCQLEREYEYQNSDEVIDENIAANEYEFDEDGNRA